MQLKERDRGSVFRKKRFGHLGAQLVGGFFTMMLLVLCVLSLYYNGTLPFSLPEFLNSYDSYGIFRRRLTEDELTEEECYPEAYDPEAQVIGAVIGIMYTFIALAIVCDEFFVPALEVMADRMNITPDVAGATLMAAGGSAPELFTNIFATFEESDAGFGTIIGSAVFNVLFVIGMCAMFSKECLNLTWWPLARDCIFYTVGLCVVAVFIGVSTPNAIVLWEALILFGMYFLYILLMYKNQNLYCWLCEKCGIEKTMNIDEVEPNEKDRVFLDTDDSVQRNLKRKSKMIGYKISKEKTNLRVPGTFRAGIQHLMLSDDGKIESWVSAKVVLDLAGDVQETFDHLDKNNDRRLDRKELGELLKDIEFPPFKESEVEKLFNELDKNKDGTVDIEEFESWYIGSEKRIKRDILQLFNEYDKDGNNVLSNEEISVLLRTTGKMTEEDIEKTVSELFEDKEDGEGITKEQFFLWYDASDLFEQHKQEAEVQEQLSRGFKELFKWPQGCFQRFWFLITLPLMILFFFTMPDVRRPVKAKYCYFTFLMSIAWIGGFAYFMVTWAIAIGDTIEIPNYIMGMTFLAAGTSIPDLLSSVIVARQGHGDMAVSSSVGSNIFDILVGLPAPWIFFTLIAQKKVKILSCELAVSIIVLIAMLIAVVTAIKLSNWKMSKGLGYSMFVLYIIFLTQDLIRNFSGDQCDTSCD